MTNPMFIPGDTTLEEILQTVIEWDRRTPRYGESLLMNFDPRDRSPRPYPSTATHFREYHGNDAWLFNPWSGERRDTRDIASDPLGLLIVARTTLASSDIVTA